MKYDSKYIKHIMEDVKELPKDVQEVYGGFNLLENDRTMFDWASKQTYIAIANMMTGVALR